jgi:NADPH:quinone reductase-like Zn-dependent oxidoreductase
MHAARLHEYGPPFGIDEVPAPTPGAGQVVIRVEGAGFCHSDLHVISGEIPILHLIAQAPLPNPPAPLPARGRRATEAAHPHRLRRLMEHRWL